MRTFQTVVIAIVLIQNVYAPCTYLNHTQACKKAKYELHIQRLMQTIRWVESRGNYTAVGGNGEYGAYQFTIYTWEKQCHKFFGKELDITTSLHQDLVAQAWIESLIDKNYTNAEIAAIWNSGRPKWIGVRGTNWAGITYNVESYVYRFLAYLNAI